MRPPVFIRRLVLVFLLLPGPLAASMVIVADAATDTTAEFDLRVQQWIEPARDIVVRQQIDLYIEVATNAFFSGGTRIAEFEVPGAIVLRREQFAVNSTRIEAGTTWAVQRWKIALYPQREGPLQVPSIPLQVFAGAQRRQIQAVTEVVDFEARLPAGFTETGVWVAAPEFTVSERYEPAGADAEMTLDVGDAFTRLIEIRARDTVAMMLPALDFTAQEGIAVYVEPPRLENSVNRGVSLAERSETISYVVERPGRYRLPEIAVDWWDTGTGERRRILLPERSVMVGPVSAADPDTSVVSTAPEMATDWLKLLYIASAGVGIGLLILAWFRFGRRTSAGEDSRSLEELIDEAVQTGDGRRLLSLLYRFIDRHPGSPGSLKDHVAALQQPEVTAAFETLLRAEFGVEQVDASPADRRILRALARMLEMRPVDASVRRDPFALN